MNLEQAIEAGYDPAGEAEDHWFAKLADQIETVTVGRSEYELWTDGVTVGIRSEDSQTVYRDYDEGMDDWSDLQYEAAHPYAERR